jgi:hypothetical protein
MIWRRYTALIRTHYALISSLQAIPPIGLTRVAPTPTSPDTTKHRLRDPIVFTVVAGWPPRDLEMRYSLVHCPSSLVYHLLKISLFITDTRLYILYFLT